MLIGESHVYPLEAVLDRVNPDKHDAFRLQSFGLLELEACISRDRTVATDDRTDRIVQQICSGIPEGNTINERSFDEVFHYTFTGKRHYSRYTSDGKRTGFVGTTKVDKLAINIAVVAAIAEDCSEFPAWETHSGAP